MSESMVRARREMDCGVARLRRRRFGVAYRARAAAAMVLLTPSVTGCYRYVPITETAAPIGSEVSVGISDQGRIGLLGQLGPGVRRLRGRLVQANDSVLVIGVSAVEYVDRAAAAQWKGETVSVRREYVTEIGERRLSRSRSWLTAGVFAALAAAVSTIAITGFGGDSGDNRVPPGGGDTE